MGREAVPDSIVNIVAVQAHKRSRGRIEAHRVNNDKPFRIRNQTQKVKPQGAAFMQEHTRGYEIICFDASDGGRAKAVIAEEHIAESEDKNAHFPLFGLKH